MNIDDLIETAKENSNSGDVRIADTARKDLIILEALKKLHDHSFPQGETKE